MFTDDATLGEQLDQTNKPKRRRVTRPAGGPIAVPEFTSGPAASSPAPAARAAAARAAAAAVSAPTHTASTASTARHHAAKQAAVEPTAPLTDTPAATPAPEPRKRHAATTLLFQAPDITPRPSRRAQAPAGPPRVHSAATTASQDGGEPGKPAEKAATSRTTAATHPKANRASSQAEHNAGTKRVTKGGKSKKAAAHSPSQTHTPTPAPESQVTPELDIPKADNPPFELDIHRLLTKAENTAAKEVAAIEAELETEIATFSAEDLVQDSEDVEIDTGRRRRRRGGRGRRSGTELHAGTTDDVATSEDDEAASESAALEPGAEVAEDAQEATVSGTNEPNTSGVEGDDSQAVTTPRRRRQRGTKADRADRLDTRSGDGSDEVTALKGSTRLEAKRQRRREGRATGRRRQIITEAEFLARRENVDRKMVVRHRDDRTQVAVLEDGILVEHYVAAEAQTSLIGNIYLGRVQNVLPSMEAAFVDIGRGRNAVLYAGEVNWDAAGLVAPNLRRIESALKSGDSVLVQVTKDPIGQKGARLTSQITLAGRYLVLVPGGGMTGISRKLPETERYRLKRVLREIVPEGFGVIVRTAAAGASEDELRNDVERLKQQWDSVQEQAEKPSASAPVLLQGEPDLAIRVVRDVFNDDFTSLVVEGHDIWEEIANYVQTLAPDLKDRVQFWHDHMDVFSSYRIDEQLAKGMDRKVWLPSGGSLVIDRTEAMTVIDVNTGKFTGVGGTLEETVTRNNLEAAEEIVRQLRLRDIGGIVVIDFIDMVLENNRDLVLRRLVECLARDRTKHQVAEVTSLGLVQMTRKRIGQGLLEAFSVPCEECRGRGYTIAADAISQGAPNYAAHTHDDTHRNRKPLNIHVPVLPEERSVAREAVKATLATIAAAAAHAHEHDHENGHGSAVELPAIPVFPALPAAPALVAAAPEPAEMLTVTLDEQPSATNGETDIEVAAVLAADADNDVLPEPIED